MSENNAWKKTNWKTANFSLEYSFVNTERELPIV